MNDRQLIVEVRDQFALKNASDAALRKILPSYKDAIDRIMLQLQSMPEGQVERELWLKSQLATIEQQFQQVSNRINDVLPAAQADDFQRSMDNAADFLKADNIKPSTVAGAQTTLNATTVAGEAFAQTATLPVIAGGDGFIRPSITRQQIEAASRSGGFSTFTLDKQKVVLDDVLPKWRKAQASTLEKVLRTGFLTGQSNQEIMRQFGPLGDGRKGWAMTEAVVRTGMSEASQAAHDAFFDANEDLLPKVPGGYRWEWDALNDTRLCPLCAPLDGMRYKTRKEMPEKPHWNCRCSKLPITATEAQMREDGDEPEGSFLERKPVTYTNGKQDPAPPGWDGENAYARPRRQGYHQSGPRKGRPQMYWVRRRALPKGRNTPGDMLKRMNDENKLAILGTKANVEEWNELIQLNAYKNDPQKLVRDILGGKRGPGRPPLPPAPPKPKPKGPTPGPSSAPSAPSGSNEINRDYAEKHQWDNGKNKLSHKAIADSLEIAANEPGLAGAHMRQMMEFQRKKKVQTMWSNGREKAFNAKGDDFAHWKNKDVIDALRANPGNDNELEFALAADLEKGKNHPFMQKIGRVSSGAAGHTIDGGNLIVMKQEAQYQALTKSSVANVRAAIKRSVEASQSGQPVQITIRDLYSKTGKTTWKTKEGWIGTYVHEMGHQVHFRAGKPAFNKYLPADLLKRAAGSDAAALEALGELRKLRWTPSKYGTTNEMERFAETFTQYVFAPDELKKASPAAYKWVEDALKEAMK